MTQRVTRQRTAVAEALIALDDFRSAQQLHEYLRAHGDSIGLATVYRTLQALAEAGQVDVLRTADGESLYRRCERREHHHHLVCRSERPWRSTDHVWSRGPRRSGPRTVSPTSSTRSSCSAPVRRAANADRSDGYASEAAAASTAPPYRRSRLAYVSIAFHRLRRSTSGQYSSRKTSSA
jgi:hypothetical protein